MAWHPGNGRCLAQPCRRVCAARPSWHGISAPVEPRGFCGETTLGLPVSRIFRKGPCWLSLRFFAWMLDMRLIGAHLTAMFRSKLIEFGSNLPLMSFCFSLTPTKRGFSMHPFVAPWAFFSLTASGAYGATAAASCKSRVALH